MISTYITAKMLVLTGFPTKVLPTKQPLTKPKQALFEGKVFALTMLLTNMSTTGTVISNRKKLPPTLQVNQETSKHILLCYVSISHVHSISQLSHFGSFMSPLLRFCFPFPLGWKYPTNHHGLTAVFHIIQDLFLEVLRYVGRRIFALCRDFFFPHQIPRKLQHTPYRTPHSIPLAN